MGQFVRNQDQRIPKFSEKGKLQRHLLSDFHQKLALIYVRITLNIKFHEILLISSRATFDTQFLPHTQTDTDRQTISRNSQILLRHSKTYKSIKNRKLLEKSNYMLLYCEMG